ncbi:N-alpha-acetyltransferase 80 [Pyxicephalus adspersus]|uniref:N-acetyltransferase domain-containing protein n=1 Tax=Pyxicephalus adspersus TaxID=30357 RepID=A0AAV2ZKA9_PYXAD|nr:TPA: hypothetical protein GDO54_016612 [Pyxicephalus adspersus]
MGENSGIGSPPTGGVILIPLHHRPDLTSSCAELLNQTWRRSLGARIHSLERSSDDFPVCLVLIGAREGPVLGHARLCRVIGLQDSLFVESVVVSTDLRGRGFGRRLMEATERYARGRGFQKLFLTTHDKQDFYHHLGYRLTEPVQNMGTLGSLLPSGMFQKMKPSKTNPTSNHQGGPPISQCPSPPECSPRTPEPLPRDVPISLPPLCPPLSPSCSTLVPPPPPPCPPPPFCSTAVPSSSSLSFLTSAVLSSTPLPPCPTTTLNPNPAPSCPPLPPSSSSCQAKTGSTLETPYRDFRGDPIFWMMKSI